jgi:CheY-like chemotaxis protein
MPKRILLADDSITIQKVVELTFSDGDYEVTAVNNGAKAIQKLSEMRPDIILSDIIMPEKNGYEVCEFVKSHPEHRTIPVVLLTGTFEPFDPDRAEKAGCDAVVTKPFESQSLIHKVEELIAQAQASSGAAPAEEPAAPAAFAAEPAPSEPEPQASPWLDEPEAPPPAPSFTTSSGSYPTTPEMAEPEAFDHGSEIFDLPDTPAATADMPFDAPMSTAFPEPSIDEIAGETRAFPRMNFDEEPQAPQAAPPSAPEPLPWDEPPVTDHSFDKTDVADLESMQEPLESAPEPEPIASGSESPFDEQPPAVDFSGETRAFTKMSFDDLERAAPEPAETEPVAEEMPAATSPWEEPADTPLFDSEPPSFPPVSFEEPAESPAPEPMSLGETSPWDEQPETLTGEGPSFPPMSFDQLESMTPQADEMPMESAPVAEEEAAPEPEPMPEPLQWNESAAPAWSAPEEPAWSASEQSEPEPAAPTESFATAAYAPFVPPPEAESLFDETPAPQEPAEEEAQPLMSADTDETQIVPPPPSEPEWAPAAAAEAAAEPEEPAIAPAALAPEAPPMPIRSAELSEDQIERIARRVVELMSDQLVRNIAWEVIPDMAEMVVKERIRQLESEA